MKALFIAKVTLVDRIEPMEVAVVGTVPFWLRTLKDVSDNILFKSEKLALLLWRKAIQDKMISKLNEYEKCPLEGNEYISLARTYNPGVLQTWELFLDQDDPDETEHVLALQSISWYAMLAKQINDRMDPWIKFSWYKEKVSTPLKHWIEDQTENVVELCITEDHYHALSRGETWTEENKYEE